MRKKDMLISFIIVIMFLYVIANLSTVNSILSWGTENRITFGDSTVNVPQAWNTTKQVNWTDKAKTNNSITNRYVVWDLWDDWPEGCITSVSEKKLAHLEHGNYKVLNTSTVDLGGNNVSRQYFMNPSRGPKTNNSNIGVTYIFTREDRNYSVQIHYFTKHDYNNSSYRKELDDRMEDFISNIHNKHYDGFFSGLNKIIHFVAGRLNIKLDF
ncbi:MULTISPECIES: hypothetical protein [Methanobrevibacter]|jgi:hypothetical protein|uniref:hypothetical protein n=1 Tax=Methanobrevibacter TaxID=2172 RepID=UPI0003348C3F|nr:MULTISPECIES: hypothetical protein [Methanobrevibacter]AGN16471.1 hypothetical protein Abm4_0574 [Methanobrevibacter sp. AbM4]MCI6774289.1 hypothetical protein [Methanobrevibacter boviskoreani]MDD6257125.1 hypothetical protein [Methanobrevibacter boviskoreani]MDY5614822.1 hypothetical protein [Methanobrevibacter boviskoreani]